ncbi:MAG: aspartate kinase [Chloroflexi bacterium]|nr:aspartate kinase [Chloroflexota bacterium]MBS58268.1 aspartate kinase [Chloroflexota bacterium]
MSLIVQKYGGSSVSDVQKINHVSRRIIERLEEGHRIVVVVSAMGNTTDQLLSLARSITDSPNPRETDVLLSTGEIVASSLIAITLSHMGVEAISLNGSQAGIITDNLHGNAMIAEINASRILKELDAGKVVIVAGFQGVGNDTDVRLLGRGASDLSAVAIAAELDAERCEIFTDVEGIYTADPRIVDDAKKIEEIGYEEMLEMASSGAKMQPRSIELGMTFQVPILVASSFNNNPGTLIHGGVKIMNPTVGEMRNRVTGVPSEKNVSKITILGALDKPGVAAEIFEPLSKAGISVDVIVQNSSNSGNTDITFTVKSDQLKEALSITQDSSSKLQINGVSSEDGFGKVSIIGTGMLNVPGYASKMFAALANASVNIEMITTSEIRITCLVKETQLDQAVRAVHSAFDVG